MKEPEINVGIVNALEIAFTLNAKFLAKGETVSGKQRVSFDEGGISWNGNVYRELTFTPLEDDVLRRCNTTYSWRGKRARLCFFHSESNGPT